MYDAPTPQVHFFFLIEPDLILLNTTADTTAPTPLFTPCFCGGAHECVHR